MLKADFHCHPLVHEYYPGINFCRELTMADQQHIRLMLGIQKRMGRDIVAITDHNMPASGLYAARYATENDLGIKVVAGAEMSVLYKGEELHVLTLGIATDLPYYKELPITELVKITRHVGGILILSHPHYYPDLGEEVMPLLDGVEEYNGVAAHLDYSSPKWLDSYTGIKLRNSDYHLGPFVAEPIDGYTLVQPDDEICKRLGL